MEKDKRIQEGWKRIRKYRRDGKGYKNQEGRRIREYRMNGEG